MLNFEFVQSQTLARSEKTGNGGRKWLCITLWRLLTYNTEIFNI